MSDNKLMSSIGSFLSRKKAEEKEKNPSKKWSSMDDAGIDISKVANIEDTISEIDPDSWKELDQIKSISPVILCVLPSTALDFVASALLSIGAYPLIPEESGDVEKYVKCASAILLDTSSRTELIETVIEHFVVGSIPLIVVCWESGTNDSRKNLTRKVIDTCSPTFITGRQGDIHALGLDVMSRVEGIIDETDDVKEKLKPVVSSDRSQSPLLDRASSPHFVRKKDAAARMYQRQRTTVPQIAMKGQFRHRSIKDVSTQSALDSARKLAAQSASFVHVFEVSVITCGEFFAEINNTQLGMENLHSTVQCCGGIVAAVIACIEEQGLELTLEQCSHAVSMYCVAGDEASAKVSQRCEIVSPGSLRVEFLDCLHRLDEQTIRSKAQIILHNTPPGS